MQRYRMILSYDGSNYAGWQVQPNGVTVQEKIESALQALSGEKAKVHGSGRTDQGVHARRQVAHFDLRQPRSGHALAQGLNALLPPDIRVLKVDAVHSNFHARKSVKSKEYRYFIWNAQIIPPFYRNHKTHVRKRLDICQMRKAAAGLIGRHDFAAFSANPHRKLESTIRHLFTLKIAKHGSSIVISAQADGFLYRMVRSIAGFLIRAGEGAVPPSEAATILSSQQRTARVPTAPPQGLFLWNVTY